MAKRRTRRKTSVRPPAPETAKSASPDESTGSPTESEPAKGNVSNEPTDIEAETGAFRRKFSTAYDSSTASFPNLKRRWRWAEASSIVAATVASFGLVVGIYPLYSQLASGRPTDSLVETLADRAGLASKRLEELDEQVVTFRNELAAITTANTDIAPGAQIAVITEKQEAIDRRLKALEAAISDSPTKALSIPILRIELDNFKEDYQSDRFTATKEIDRIYDQNKWFIGLMATMALSLIGLAVSNFMLARKNEKEEQP